MTRLEALELHQRICEKKHKNTLEEWESDDIEAIISEHFLDIRTAPFNEVCEVLDLPYKNRIPLPNLDKIRWN